MDKNKIRLHLTAPENYETLKNELENVNTYMGNLLEIKIINWDYTLGSLRYWATDKQEDKEEADILLIFDAASYQRVDSVHDEALYYKDFIESLKDIRLNTNSKIVLILSRDKEENLELINELLKINIHNFHFAQEKFTINDVLDWIFATKTLKDNAKYLLTGKGEKRTKVIEQSKIEIKEVEKVIEKKKIIGFSRKIICVPGNPEFTAEAAYIVAKAMPDYKVCILNLDNRGYLDVIFNLINENGLNSIINSINKGFILSVSEWKGSRAKGDLPDNLYIFTNKYNTQSELSEDTINKLIISAHNFFDIVFVLVPLLKTNIEFVSAVKVSNIILMPVKPSVPCIREANSTIQQAPEEKIWHVAWSYDKTTDLPVGIFKKSMLNDQYAGRITYSHSREKARNTGGFSYLETAYKENYREYLKILRRFNLLLPKRNTAFQTIKLKIKRSRII